MRCGCPVKHETQKKVETDNTIIDGSHVEMSVPEIGKLKCSFGRE